MTGGAGTGGAGATRVAASAGSQRSGDRVCEPRGTGWRAAPGDDENYVYAIALPASAVVPLAISLLGLSEVMVLVVIAFGALWPVLLATVHGFSAVEPRLYEVSRALGLSRSKVILKIALPSSMPDIVAGMRLALTVSLILAVVGEMLASREGLGSQILLAARSFRSPDLFAGVILLGATGYLSAVFLTMIESRVLCWRASR